MARTKAPEAPARGPLWRAYPDGPTPEDVADESSPWFVDEVVRDSYLEIATDEFEVRRVTKQDHPVNVRRATIAFGQMWRDQQGQAPTPDTYTMKIAVGGPAGRDHESWEQDAKVTTRASDETIFRHMMCLAEAWTLKHRQDERARQDEADRRANTCTWCGEYERGQGQKCPTCELALEFERMRRAAESERGARAVKKVRAALQGKG